jgi:hypothetical protein
MSFLIVNIVDGRLGVVKERKTIKLAINEAVRIAHEQQSDVPEEEIRAEIEQDGNWSSNQGDIWVHIVQSEKN